MGGNYYSSGSGSGSQYSISNGSAGSSYMSGSRSGLTPAQILNAYSQFLPGTLNSIGNASANALAPTGSGTAAATAGNAVQRSLNPEYYGALDTATGSAMRGARAGNQLLNAINLNGLSPGEYNATERGLNQYNTGTGNAGLANPTNAITNAMNFGGAFNNKLGILGSAIGANTSASGAATNAAGAASPNTSGFNPVQIALGNTGFGASYINPITAVSQQNASGASSAANMSFGAGGSSNSSQGCCFIFMEAYHGTMPKSVRRVRDKFYRAHPEIARGYKKMAKWLVPLIRDYDTVRSIVWKFMIAPATRHCEDFTKARRISHFWLRVWAIYGRI